MTDKASATLQRALLGVLFTLSIIFLGYAYDAAVSRIEAAEVKATAADAVAAKTRNELDVVKALMEQNTKDHAEIKQQLQKLIDLHLREGVR